MCIHRLGQVNRQISIIIKLGKYQHKPKYYNIGDNIDDYLNNFHMNTNMDHNIGDNMDNDLEIIHMNTNIDDNMGDKIGDHLKISHMGDNMGYNMGDNVNI